MSGLINKKEHFEALDMCQESIDYYTENNLWGTTDDESIAFLLANGKENWVRYWEKVKREKAELIKQLSEIDFIVKGYFHYGISKSGVFTFTTIAEVKKSIDEQRKEHELRFFSECVAINHSDILEDGSEVWHPVPDLDANTEDDNRFQCFNYEAGQYVHNLTKNEVRLLITELKDRWMAPFKVVPIYKKYVYPDGDIVQEKVDEH